jgi:hypothetical protein
MRILQKFISFYLAVILDEESMAVLLLVTKYQLVPITHDDYTHAQEPCTKKTKKPSQKKQNGGNPNYTHQHSDTH